MLIFGRVKVFENGFVVDTFDENNETSWPSWKDVWCATFGNRRLGRPSSRGGAGCRRPYPLSTSQSHIQIYTLTLRLPPQHSSFLKCQDQPDNTTTCTSFPLPDSAQYLPRFHLQRVDPPTSLQAHTGSLLMTHACSLIKLLLIGDSGESGYF